jgi:hypothetical protein
MGFYETWCEYASFVKVMFCRQYDTKMEAARNAHAGFGVSAITNEPLEVLYGGRKISTNSS